MKYPVIAVALGSICAFNSLLFANGLKLPETAPTPPSTEEARSAAKPGGQTAAEISAEKEKPGAPYVQPLVPAPAQAPDRQKDGASPQQAASPAPAASEEPEWSVAGDWWMTHPSFQGKMIIREDGTFMRPHGDGGRWSITSDRGSVVLVFRWDNWGTESLAMTGPDSFRGKIRKGPMWLHRILGEAAAKPAADQRKQGAELRILSAMYGVGDRRIDITEILQKIVKNGRLEIQSPWNLGKEDPFAGQVKSVIIQYRINGEARTARFSEEEAILLPKS